MAAYRFVQDILQPHVLPYMQRIPGSTFQQDNARSHTAMPLPNGGILPWPARSPDSSPIAVNVSGIIWDGELGIPRV
ncbi:hypothetical protein TNCV_5134371 [Trichonephila clavipes]|nr:hypothetical protein TNCV_5134371 [Trichonephila clavipes]